MNTSSSELTPDETRQIIQRLAALLNEANLAAFIDAPVDEAVSGFDGKIETPITHAQFLDVVASFVRHLHVTEAACPQIWSPQQARDEAVALVTRAYGSNSAVPYEAALCEAFDESMAGMRAVIGRIAEDIKATRRERYERWIRARHIDPLDWPVKCAVAKAIMDRCAAYLPAGEGRVPLRPEMLVDHISALIKAWASMDQSAADGFAETFLKLD